jgi:acetyl-CoA acetyltransferase
VTDRFEERCIVSGIGQSEVGRRLTRGVTALTLDACLAAIADAGLTPADIDGVVSWPGAVSRAEGLAPPGPGSSGPGVHAIIDALRLKTRWHYGGPETPGMFAAVINACMAVASGLCRHVLVYRALNEATAWRLATERVSVNQHGVEGAMQWMLPYGAFSGPNWMGLWAMRHMHEFGTTREQFAAIALNARRNAQRNPKAVLQGDLTIDEYLSSTMISDPLCLFDCDIAVDGATAVIVSTADHTPDVPGVPLQVEAVGSALQGRASWDQWEDMTETAAAGAGAHLWSRTDLKPGDVDIAGLYDGFTVLTLFWLEGMRFCGKGESGPFVESGRRIGLGGELPLATGGGQLSAGRLHGFGHLYEVCLQLRGEATGRQVADAKVGAVSAGAGPLASCLLLRRT